MVRVSLTVKTNPSGARVANRSTAPGRGIWYQV